MVSLVHYLQYLLLVLPRSYSGAVNTIIMDAMGMDGMGYNCLIETFIIAAVARGCSGATFIVQRKLVTRRRLARTNLIRLELTSFRILEDLVKYNRPIAPPCGYKI